MNIRVLLVESEPEDVIFLKEVLVEIEAGRYWKTFVSIETIHVNTWTSAAAVLINEQIDVLLLDPNLSDIQGIDTFRHAQAIAQHVPVILLTGPEDDDTSIRMVREGAQDFLIKRHIDCRPLAHAMRLAIERHRLLNSARAASLTDSLTGLPNRSGFTSFANRDRKLAERLGRRMMILLAEPKNLAEIASTFGNQRRDLTLVEAADHLRSLISPADMAARVGELRFGIVMLETDAESLESTWARLHSTAETHHIRVGAAIFDPVRPVSLDTLLEQAAADMAPSALAAKH
jgi:diguanylate cyclase (GGDEF)-like protein